MAQLVDIREMSQCICEEKSLSLIALGACGSSIPKTFGRTGSRAGITFDNCAASNEVTHMVIVNFLDDDVCSL